ncbi:unnamed protein product [Arctogadus glacialis]
MGEPSPGGSQTGLQDDSGKGQHNAGERGEGWISPQCVPDGAQPQIWLSPGAVSYCSRIHIDSRDKEQRGSGASVDLHP